MPSAKVGPYQLHALEARWREWVIPPSGIDRLSHYIWSALPKFVGRSLALDLSLGRLRLPIPLAAGHDCPDHPGVFVGQSHGRDLRRTPRKQLQEPRSARAIALSVSNDGKGADDEHLAQVSIALLGDAAEPLLSAAGVLSRNQTDSGRQVATSLEGRRIGHGGDHGAGQKRPDARDLHQPAADLGRAGVGPDQAIGLQDLQTRSTSIVRQTRAS